MTYIPTGSSAGAAAAIANAVKASGAIVKVEPEDFLKILERCESPLVVTAEGGFLSSAHQYLSGYRGLVFYCKSSEALRLPGTVEIIRAKRIWIPG